MIDYRNNIGIDFKDLIVGLHNKWKYLLLAAVIGAILFGTIFVINKKSQMDISNDDMTTSSMSVENLSNKDRMEVELAYRAWVELRQLYNQLDNASEEWDVDTKIELMKATQQILLVSEKFSNAQKKYYSNMFEEEDSSNENVQAGSDYAEISHATLLYEISFYFACGAIIGALVFVLVFAILYCLIPTLKTENDIRNAFQLPILGRIGSSVDIDVQSMYHGILAFAHKQSLNTVYMISSKNEPLVAQLTEMFKENESVCVKSGIGTDFSVISEVVEADGVIIFERIGKSRYEDIASEIEMCKNYGAPIMGAVVINCK